MNPNAIKKKKKEPKLKSRTVYLSYNGDSDEWALWETSKDAAMGILHKEHDANMITDELCNLVDLLGFMPPSDKVTAIHLTIKAMKTICPYCGKK